MEIINKFKYFIAATAVLLILAAIYFFNDLNQTKKKQSYFDIYLANSYNDLSNEAISLNLDLLSRVNDLDISFFADLKKSSMLHIDKYNNLDKNLITLKNSIVNKKNIDIDFYLNSDIFPETATLYYLNNNINNSDLKSIDPNNFFYKAIKLYLDDN